MRHNKHEKGLHIDSPTNIIPRICAGSLAPMRVPSEKERRRECGNETKSDFWHEKERRELRSRDVNKPKIEVQRREQFMLTN